MVSFTTAASFRTNDCATLCENQLQFLDTVIEMTHEQEAYSRNGGLQLYRIYSNGQRKKLCEHHRLKGHCIACGGGYLCSHRRRKYCCIECGGSQVCSHQVTRARCSRCRPEVRQYWRQYQCRRRQNPHIRKLNSLKGELHHVRKVGRFGNNSKLREYVRCSSDFLRQWLDYTERQYCDGTTTKTNIDHLKPLSQIRPDCDDDFHTYFSWHNTRIIPALANRIKYRKEPTAMEKEEQECHIADFLDLVTFCK